MYAAPPEILAEIHTEVPEALRIRGRSSEWLYGRPGPTPYSFLEGPSFDRAGNLWLTDIVFGRIFKVTRERVRQIEAKAVRKLQHPVRSRQLEGFLDGLKRT